MLRDDLSVILAALHTRFHKLDQCFYGSFKRGLIFGIFCLFGIFGMMSLKEGVRFSCFLLSLLCFASATGVLANLLWVNMNSPALWGSEWVARWYLRLYRERLGKNHDIEFTKLTKVLERKLDRIWLKVFRCWSLKESSFQWNLAKQQENLTDWAQS